MAEYGPKWIPCLISFRITEITAEELCIVSPSYQKVKFNRENRFTLMEIHISEYLCAHRHVIKPYQ